MDKNKEERVHFDMYFPMELENDAEYLEKVIFCDECKFSSSGGVNK